MLANLRALFGVVVDIVLLRRGPETLPASGALLGVVVTIYVVLYAIATHVFILSTIPVPPRTWALQIVLAVIIQLAWLRGAFQIVGKPERFLQTATAVFAVSTLFIPALAVIGALMPYLKEGATAQPPALLGLLVAFIWVWMLVVMIRIVRAAFEWNWLVSIVFVIAANIVPMIILSILFGDSPQPV